jgi:hypothetical protein
LAVKKPVKHSKPYTSVTQEPYLAEGWMLGRLGKKITPVILVCWVSHAGIVFVLRGDLDHKFAMKTIAGAVLNSANRVPMQD